VLRYIAEIAQGVYRGNNYADRRNLVRAVDLLVSVLVSSNPQGHRWPELRETDRLRKSIDVS
jgi:hypothetical protein